MGKISKEKDVIGKNELFKVLARLRDSDKSVNQDSFFYYALMYATAARNSAIRSLRFEHFRKNRKEGSGFEYREQKTGKAGVFFILFPEFWLLFEQLRERSYKRWKRRGGINMN